MPEVAHSPRQEPLRDLLGLGVLIEARGQEGRAGIWMTAMPMPGGPEVGPSRPACRNAACKNARALGIRRRTIVREPCSWGAAMSTSELPALFRAVRSTPTSTSVAVLDRRDAVSQVALDDQRLVPRKPRNWRIASVVGASGANARPPGACSRMHSTILVRRNWASCMSALSNAAEPGASGEPSRLSGETAALEPLAEGLVGQPFDARED